MHASCFYYVLNMRLVIGLANLRWGVHLELDRGWLAVIYIEPIEIQLTRGGELL